MLAPVALYPDPLLSQILMGATYPIEVVEAARWSRANRNLRGDDAVRAVQDKDWDPSVKSLVAFPNVLQRMDENIEWTRQLGDAFLAQEPHVMETVQQLRRKAQAAGNLQSNDQVRVVDDGGYVVLEPVSPRVVYVPYYDPWVVYGPWWWAAYPPFYWAPWPGYVVVYHHYPWRPAPAVVGVVWGPSVTVSVGFFFGGVDWRERHVRVVHVDNYYVNRTVVANRTTTVNRNVTTQQTTRANIAPGRWQHDPAHRRGVAYRDAGVQQRFAATAQTREAQPGARPDSNRDRGLERRDARQEQRIEQKGQVRPAPRQAPERRAEQRQPENAAPAAPAERAARPEAKREPRSQNSRPFAQPQPQPQPRAAQPAPEPQPQVAQPRPRLEAKGNGQRPQRVEKAEPRREVRREPPRKKGGDDRS